jgi:heme/copper-type cytochrome/quinol oxidase subunit 2
MAQQQQTQSAPSLRWNFEAMALIVIASICLLVNLALVIMLFMGASKVRNAPAVPANQITAPKELNFMPR